jgi:hypothetical protein
MDINKRLMKIKPPLHAPACSTFTQEFEQFTIEPILSSIQTAGGFGGLGGIIKELLRMLAGLIIEFGQRPENLSIHVNDIKLPVVRRNGRGYGIITIIYYYLKSSMYITLAHNSITIFTVNSYLNYSG